MTAPARTPFASPHLRLVPSAATPAPSARGERPSAAHYLLSQADAAEQRAEREAFHAGRRAEIEAERWAVVHAAAAVVALVLGFAGVLAVMFGAGQ